LHKQTIKRWQAVKREGLWRRFHGGIFRWDNVGPVGGGSKAESLKAFFAQFDDARPSEGADRC
jgi:hypothetical protein